MAFSIPPQASLAPYIPITPAPTTWTRPVDWPVITDNANELNFLLSDIGLASFAITTTFTGTGNIYIEWGDGVTTTISSGASTTTYKNYTIGSGTACSLGYTTFKCRIYADPGVTGITQAQFIGTVRTSDSRNVLNSYASGILEIYLGDTLTKFTTYNNYLLSWTGIVGSAVGNYDNVNYFKFPATVTASDFTSCFQNCANLARVIMPTSAVNMSLCASMFNGCSALQSITFPADATGITTLLRTFYFDYNLTSVIFPPTLNSCTTLADCFQGNAFLASVTMPASMNACTTMSNTFNSCYNLTRITLPTLNACITYSSTFNSCYNIQQIIIKGWNTNINQTLTLSSMFNSCFALTTIDLPTSCASGTIPIVSTMFANCYNLMSLNISAFTNVVQLSPGGASNSIVNNCFNLISIILPSSMPSLTQLLGTFNTNRNLQSITMPTSAPSMTNMQSAFQNCSQLRSITLPTTVGATISLPATFSNCIALTSVTIPSGWNLTSLNQTFQGCTSLQTVVLPNNAQNSLISLASTFSSCVSLTSVTMPTSMTAVTDISSCFAGCVNLINGPIFPATMNSVTTAFNAFSGCTKLTSVTLPTSMTACTNWQSVFTACDSLRSITLPATVSTGAINFTSCFQLCFNLTTVTLPTSQSTGLTNMTTMFDTCPALTTINNLNRLGDINTTANNYINATTFISQSFGGPSGPSFTGKFSKLVINGVTGPSPGYIAGLSGLRLTNTATGQWAGTSPQIDISYTNMSQANLVTLFGDLTSVTGKTINITGAVGAAALTAGERAIATGKGWTITG